MQAKFTINGTLIPQDPETNDMCLLFLKFGRCRFKQKCKKSHWVPPLPEEPFPVKLKPPLPNNDEESTNQKPSSKLTCLDDLGSKSCRASGTLIKIHSTKLIHSSFPSNKELNSSQTNKTLSSIGLKNILQDENGLANNITSKVCDPCKTNMKRKMDNLTDKSMIQPKKRKHIVLQRRFKHIFQDCSHEVMEYSGIEKMFRDAGAFYDWSTQKVNVTNPPKNKAEKYRLKTLRRLHWERLQTLKEKLAHFPPSYFLKFDRNKINFTRLRPYIYILIHECLHSGLAKKPIKPSSFDILIADTLIAYLDTKCVTAQEAEEKLQHWGARAVRARQCIDHLWHVMAVSSKSSNGCANEVIEIEQEVIRGSRTALDYAYACSLALGRTKFKLTTAKDNHAPRKISSSVKQELKAAVRNVSEEKNENVHNHQSFPVDQEINSKCLGAKTNNAERTSIDSLPVDQETKSKDLGQKTNNANAKSVRERTLKKRRRSRQFRKVSLNERKKMKTRFVNLLSTLT